MRALPFLLAIVIATTVGATVVARADDAGGRVPETVHSTPLPPTTDGGRAYLNDRERGWSWYETHPTPPPPPPTPPPTPAKAAPTESPPFSVAWLRKHLEDAKIAAIDNPTRDNVEYFAYLQKISMDRAEKFARMVQTVNTLNPTLDETIQNPVSTYARAARRDIVSADRERVLKALGNDLGIYYFFKSDCPYCAKQSPLLVLLQNQYGFHVLPISLDHRPLLDGSYPQWVPDMGQGAALNITSTPTLYLYRPPHSLVILSVGLQTLPDLETKILTSAHAHGWLGDSDFEQAVRGSTQAYLVDAATSLQQVDWSDPVKALAALRAASAQASETATDATLAPQTFQGSSWGGH